MRLFYSLPLSQQVADALFDASVRLRKNLKDGNVTPKENLHITVSFVGNVNEIKADILAEILRETASQNYAPQLIFSPPTQLHGADLICSKIKLNDNLLKINKDIVAQLEKKGFTAEKRFTPHVTLIRRPVFSVPFATLKSQTEFDIPLSSCDSIALVESRLNIGARPQYIPVEVCKFRQ